MGTKELRMDELIVSRMAPILFDARREGASLEEGEEVAAANDEAMSLETSTSPLPSERTKRVD